MASLLRNGLLIGGSAGLLFGAADAQTVGAYHAAQNTQATQTTVISTVSPRRPLVSTDAAYLRSALDAAKRGDAASIRQAMAAIQDPIARKIALWALADGAPDSMTFLEADRARRELAEWPRASRRRAAAEKRLEISGLTPGNIVQWFSGAEPETAEGAMALASAWRMSGQPDEAAALIRRFWRDKVFEADVQRTMLARFGDVLTPQDHVRRADILLYGPQGPAAREMVAMLPEPDRTIAQLRIDLRADSDEANRRVMASPSEIASHPGVMFERASYLRRKGMDTVAIGLARGFAPPITQEAGERMWTERKRLIASALRAGAYQDAYRAASNTGMSTGVEAAEAEFYAGWLALTRMKNADLAAKHFAILANAGTSPLTRSRALYWQGRAAEAQGDLIGAQGFYGEGAKHLTTFYGQLAAEKVGLKTLDLGRDPVITPADRARFESREVVRAAHMLSEVGAQDAFRVFVLHIDDILPTAEEHALLVDLARAEGGADLAMRAARTAAQRGFILPERGYPLLIPPNVPGGAEQAFVLSISRQESNFNPTAQSSVGARGMMQLMPATAQLVARKIGESYSPERLHDPHYNMRLGSTYLGDLIRQFDGSYIMAAAGYNAGPGRPRQWVGFCGDPRASTTDPLDFIECIPFSETRNYVMRTLETTQVYRARLNGGSTPLRLSADLNRGGYGSYASAEPTTSQP